MKKDALYWGIIAAFASFFLLAFWMAYDVWKTGKERRRAQMMEVQETVSQVKARDFSQMETIRGKDGKFMVLIPESPFSMGSLEGDGGLDEMPQRIVYLSAYYIDLHEVTFAEFNGFVEASGFLEEWSLSLKRVFFEDDPSLITAPDQPAVGVSWAHAQAYCEWAGKRLPTEAEWEKAAGEEQHISWPWGNTYEEGLANTQGDDDGYRYSAPPGQYERGRSPYGLYDMAGNVAEWVADVYDPNYYKISPFRNPKGPDEGKHRVYRGGSWNDSFANVRTAKRFAAALHQASAVLGFRCARDAFVTGGRNSRGVEKGPG